MTVPQENLSGTAIPVNKENPATLSYPSTPHFLAEKDHSHVAAQGFSPELPILEKERYHLA